MRILFMGTPEISALCLKRIVADGYEVVSVVTGEDKPRGRKMLLTPTAVKLAANELNIPVLTPKTLRGEDFMAQLAEISPDIIVVVAYGKILPPEVINYPRFGCINLHVSLLPKYRGAAPMQRAIMDGEGETGVTVMQMDEGLDTGDIISCEKFPIESEDDLRQYTINRQKSAALFCQKLLPISSRVLPCAHRRTVVLRPTQRKLKRLMLK